MDKKKWLESYSGQSVQELIYLESDHRVDSLVLAFEQAIQRKSAHKGGSSLTRDERLVLAIEALEREVNNGGYSQFFVNSSREYAAIIVDSLETIDCPRTAEITRQAIRALRLNRLTHTEIESEMEKENAERDSRLELCDKEYFNTLEPIAESLFRHIKAHRWSFVL